VKYGAGADLLIHEVAMARPALMAQAYMQRIIGHHTTPHEAGLVFSRTNPRLAAYTHLVLPGSDTVLPATVADLIAETRTTYPGPLEIGEDLMSFEIEAAAITVRRGKSVRIY
jgi:ribonuclease Z